MNFNDLILMFYKPYKEADTMYYEFYQLFHHIIGSVQMINVFMSTLLLCDIITRVNMQGFENFKCFNMLNST